MYRGKAAREALKLRSRSALEFESGDSDGDYDDEKIHNLLSRPETQGGAASSSFHADRETQKRAGGSRGGGLEELPYEDDDLEFSKQTTGRNNTQQTYRSSQTIPEYQRHDSTLDIERDDDLFENADPLARKTLATTPHRPRRTLQTLPTPGKRQRSSQQQQHPTLAPRRMPAGYDDEMDIAYGSGDTPRNAQSVNEMYRRIKELERVKEDYDYLVNLRFTEAELLHKRYVEAKNKQLEAADDYLRKLEEELEQRTKENQDLKQQVQHSKANQELMNQVERLNQEIATVSQENALLKEAEHHANKSAHMFQDLSGLVITDVKPVLEGDMYNCVQTGRRGTLHFKLLCEKPNEFQYIPLLDRKRDAELISSLPVFLTTEIVFQKEKAHVFYSKLRSALDSSNTT